MRSDVHPILTAVVGSTLHGTIVNDGLEDLDLMSVVVESPEEMVGLSPNDFWIERTKPEHVRSEAGDVDHVKYGLRKYLRLALKCNPTILLPLFAPKESIRYCTVDGIRLRTFAPKIVSKLAYAPFSGYMQQQLQRLLGKCGQKRTTRPELIERYGYDTKYAGHVIRLGYQGEELLLTGKITLPMPEEQRRIVVDVRTGHYSLNEVAQMVDELTVRLRNAYESSPLPEEPDIEAVQSFMVNVYLTAWREPE